MSSNEDYDNMRIGVVGGGSWGTALANLLAVKGYVIDWWVFEPELVAQISEQRENSVFLPGITLSTNLTPTNDLQAVIHDKDLVLIVVPSHVMRLVTEKMNGHLSPDAVVVSASKGIENNTQLTMSAVISQSIPSLDENHLAVLSGPSFAIEVARCVPTVITAASKDPDCAQMVQQVFSTPWFRVYTHHDIIGAELGGAVKNVIAIAAGMIDGLGLGLNTRAALITRGLAEMIRLGQAMGADPMTFSGSAGLGDLVLTCTGDLSRNHTIGKKIGQGAKLNDLLKEMRMVAEGVKTARSVYNLSRRMGVEMPIAHAIYHILYEDLDPKEAVGMLMTRDLKSELDDI